MLQKISPHFRSGGGEAGVDFGRFNKNNEGREKSDGGGG